MLSFEAQLRHLEHGSAQAHHGAQCFTLPYILLSNILILLAYCVMYVSISLFD